MMSQPPCRPPHTTSRTLNRGHAPRRRPGNYDAVRTGKAARHHPAGEKLAQLPFHEARQALTAAQTCFGEKRLEVLAHHLVQDGLLGPAADVRMARSAERGVPGCRKRLGSDTVRRSALGPTQARRRRPLLLRRFRHGMEYTLLVSLMLPYELTHRPRSPSRKATRRPPRSGSAGGLRLFAPERGQKPIQVKPSARAAVACRVSCVAKTMDEPRRS